MQVRLLTAPVSLTKGAALAPVRVVRARKPRSGGITLAELTNLDGRGVARAVEFAAGAGHTIVSYS